MNVTLEEQLAAEAGWRFKGVAVESRTTGARYEMEALAPDGIGRVGKGVGPTREAATRAAVEAAIVNGFHAEAVPTSEQTHGIRQALIWAGWRLAETPVSADPPWYAADGWVVQATPPGPTWGTHGDRFGGSFGRTQAEAIRGAVLTALGGAVESSVERDRPHRPESENNTWQPV